MGDSRLDEIAAAYDATRRRTLAVWQRSPTAGKPAPPPYHLTRRAYAIGSLFTSSPSLERVYPRVAAADGVDIVARENLHYTFLALTPHQWDDVDAMPDAQFLAAAALRHLQDIAFEISDLRLLPLPDVLLLAGVPSRTMLDARDRLITELLANPTTAAWLKERYGYAFPPLFWDTTLARSRTALLPPPLRALFDQFADTTFGTLSMPPPRLHAVNFDWTLRQPI